jgi:hypothetical protein
VGPVEKAGLVTNSGSPIQMLEESPYKIPGAADPRPQSTPSDQDLDLSLAGITMGTTLENVGYRVPKPAPKGWGPCVPTPSFFSLLGGGWRETILRATPLSGNHREVSQLHFSTLPWDGGRQAADVSNEGPTPGPEVTGEPYSLAPMKGPQPPEL